MTFHANTDELALESELPDKVSELENDSGFITASAIPSNVGAFTNDVGYLTASSSAFVAKRDKTDISYEQSFDKNHLEGIMGFNIVETSAPLTTIVLDKYDAASQTWSGDTHDWKVVWYYEGMGENVMFQLYYNNIGVQAF